MQEDALRRVHELYEETLQHNIRLQGDVSVLGQEISRLSAELSEARQLWKAGQDDTDSDRQKQTGERGKGKEKEEKAEKDIVEKRADPVALPPPHHTRAEDSGIN